MKNKLKNDLKHNVPRFIDHIKNRGGVSVEEWEWVRNESEDINYPLHLLDKADEFLFYPNCEDKYKFGLFILVKALAIISFAPGGATIFGLIFNADSPNYVLEEYCREEISAFNSVGQGKENP